ncbi:MAG: CNP1-like family protein [Pseudomonadota bacterium]|nr:CNP1-like family protein [Pseudomonadota bacterium]
MKKTPPSRLPLLQIACALAMACPAWAQSADEGRADWKEDSVPPPPAYGTSQLIEIEMPRASSVRMGLDPETISISHDSGVVRYVVVARGPSAVNATYEGIRCATGEYRVYARQVQGNDWVTNSDAEWKAMRGQSSVMVQHPYRLAREGMCLGTSVRPNVPEMVRELKSGNRSLYY